MDRKMKKKYIWKIDWVLKTAKRTISWWMIFHEFINYNITFRVRRPWSILESWNWQYVWIGSACMCMLILLVELQVSKMFLEDSTHNWQWNAGKQKYKVLAKTFTAGINVYGVLTWWVMAGLLLPTGLCTHFHGCCYCIKARSWTL